MAGRPILAAFTAWLAEQGDDGTGEDWLFGRIADGETVTALGREFNELLGFGSRRLIYTWVKQGGDVRMAAYKEALRMSAEALVDKGREAHEDLAERGPTVAPAEVSAVKNRGDWYKWEASKRDKENFGDGPSVGEALTDLGSMFLSALQSHGHVDSLPEGEAQMATPRMQRKLEIAQQAAEEGETLSPEELEVVADGGTIEDEGRPEVEIVDGFLDESEDSSDEAEVEDELADLLD